MKKLKKLSDLEKKILFCAFNNFDKIGGNKRIYPMDSDYFARRFGVLQGTATTALKNLKDEGYVISDLGETNVNVYGLTPTGRKFCKEHRFTINNFFKHPVTSAIIGALIGGGIVAWLFQ